ncbi:MAG TPA: lipocalin family protein [Candidatus Krumholzibacteria bacterium]|nr:lipocalin family protein [Candidatus Krumholzibacteria bacterium]
MNTIIGIFFCFLAALFAAAPTPAATAADSPDSAATDTHPVTAVSQVDLSRYIGLWHEVAKIPNKFQKMCDHGTTAEYTLREDGRITVVNRCVNKDGGTEEAKGVAKVEDTVSNAKLKVSFVSFLGWRPFWGDYWVIGLDENYQWAVVGTPNRKYGWILARTPTLDDATLEQVFGILERNGYTRTAFEMSAP